MWTLSSRVMESHCSTEPRLYQSQVFRLPYLYNSLRACGRGQTRQSGEVTHL
ncbi:hypothetical protein DPMN_129158 [Dreissena polymorpha]|uniref:Uncharacterized protein n=1 Tax=Dreissena polymorpha TaxID=45954 RepID=A0A9D4H251_DREPO|nr:hypothetical protein DPMN_129158 [Dreissena polymorpha]